MNRPLITLIAEDEPYARSSLEALVSNHSDLRHGWSAANGLQAMELIKTNDIDLAFLDIKMPGLTGIELAQHIYDERKRIQVIFVTAFDQHAVKAFELCAVDYLLKPLSSKRFLEAVERVKTRTDMSTENLKWRQLMGLVKPQKLAVTSVEGTTHLLNINQLIWIESCNHHVIIHSHEGSITARDTMERWQTALGQAAHRIDRSAIVMLDAVLRIEPWSSRKAHLALSGSHTLAISRRKASELQQKLTNINH